MSIYWELPLKKGHKYKRSTVCLAGLSYGNHIARGTYDSMNSCVTNKDGIRIRNEPVGVSLDELVRQAETLDVPYICLDYKRHALENALSHLDRDEQGNTIGVRGLNNAQVKKLALKHCRKRLLRARQIVNDIPWMKEFIKIDTIRLRVYGYTHVPTDQWFNGMSIIKNTIYSQYDFIWELLLDKGLSYGNAAKLLMIFRFGKSAFSNDGEYVVTDMAASSDMMTCIGYKMRTSDVENYARGIIFPYGSIMRGSKGYSKFGRDANQLGEGYRRYHYHTVDADSNSPYRRATTFAMSEMFHQPIEEGGEVGDIGVFNYHNGHTSVTDVFNAWVSIFLRIQNEEGATNV